MRTIVESARTMLLVKNLSNRLWAEAVNTAVYILNRCVSSLSHYMTPFELWTQQQKPNLVHIRIFGSIAYAHITKEFCKKFDAKSKRCILVGYQGDSKNYRLYNPSVDRIIISRDVIFNEIRRNVKLKHDGDYYYIITIKSEATENNNRRNHNDEYEDTNDDNNPTLKKLK